MCQTVAREKAEKQQEEVTSRLEPPLATLHYLAGFGPMPYSFFGLFLSHCDMVHWLGYILLNVVNYVTLKNTEQSIRYRATGHRQKSSSEHWLNTKHIVSGNKSTKMLTFVSVYCLPSTVNKQTSSIIDLFSLKAGTKNGEENKE